MHDENLDELMSDLERAGSDSASSYERGGGANAYAREIAEARAAIVAHVREREVELMGLAMYARTYREWLRGSPTEAVTEWRAVTDMTRHELTTPARALRDAYDQAGAPREGER